MGIKVVGSIETPVKPERWLVIHLPVERREGFYKVLELASERYSYTVVETGLPGDMLRFNILNPDQNDPLAFFHLGVVAGQFWAKYLRELGK